MSRTWAALPAVALILACGCSGSEPKPAQKPDAAPTTQPGTTAPTETATAKKAAFEPLSDRERDWVRAYATWRDGLFPATATIEDIRATWRFILLDPSYEDRPVARYLRTLRKIERCAGSLARDVRDPPKAALNDVFDLLEQGCELMERSAASDRKAIAAKDGDAFDSTQADWDEGFLRHQRADEAVLQHLTFMRPLPVKRGKTGASRIEPVFGDVATRISMENQEVRCWSRRDWKLVLEDRSAYTAGKIEPHLLGFAGLAEPAHLAPEVCEALVDLRYRKERPDGEAKRELAEAAVVLAHEAEHVIGTVEETVTECRAMQRLRQTARLFGASRAYAASLAETFWEDVYPYNLPAYKTSACRDGGPLDLRPGSSVWP